MQELHINVQDQTEEFYFETTENTAFTLRVYLYQTLNDVVTPYTLTVNNTAKFYYFVDATSSEVVQVSGTVTAGLSYVDFDFTVAKTAINGRFSSSINIYDVNNDPEVWANGQTYLNRNPSTGSNTALDTTTVINWSEITNEGNIPWSVSNDITVISNCASSPYDVNETDATKMYVLSEALTCDFTFNLPAASNVYSTTYSPVFSFQQLNNSNVIILQADGTDTIDDSGAGGTKSSVRNWGGSSIPSATLYLRASNVGSWVTIWGDSCWNTSV